MEVPGFSQLERCGIHRIYSHHDNVSRKIGARKSIMVHIPDDNDNTNDDESTMWNPKKMKNQKIKMMLQKLGRMMQVWIQSRICRRSVTDANYNDVHCF